MGMFVKVDKDDYAYDYDYTWEKSPIKRVIVIWMLLLFVYPDIVLRPKNILWMI